MDRRHDNIDVLMNTGVRSKYRVFDMHDDPNFTLSRNRIEQIEHMGGDDAPVLIVDDAFEDPNGLRAIALGADWAPIAGNGQHFPGVRAEAPAAYGEAIIELLTPHLGDVFALPESAKPTIALRHFSIVSTPPSALALPQRLPHIDTTHPNQLAVIHYLVGSPFGGTNFFRHRETGWLRMGPDRFGPYSESLVRSVKTKGVPPAQYIEGDTDLFEKVGGVDARFNRVAAYFSNALHSGEIRRDAPLDPTPSRGRLTISTFIRWG